MLDELKKFKTVEAAAAEMAGNWTKWSCFVWFGSTEYPQSDKIMLGYTTGPQSGWEDLVEHELVAKTLEPYLGMHKDPTKTADKYGADFHGDRKALSGFMVRVVDKDGQITEAFRKLYALARTPLLDIPNYQETRNTVNRRELLRYVRDCLPSVCLDQCVAYHDDLIETVVDCLIESDENIDTVDEDTIGHELENIIHESKE